MLQVDEEVRESSQTQSMIIGSSRVEWFSVHVICDDNLNYGIFFNHNARQILFIRVKLSGISTSYTGDYIRGKKLKYV